MSRPCSSPLTLDGEQMSIEAFQDLYRVPGFKYEYTQGRADISVQRSAYAIVAARPEWLCSPNDEALPAAVTVEAAAGTAVEALVPLWVEAFANTPDYHGWAIKDVRQDARESLTRLLDAPSAAGHPASRLARWNGTLIGALLIDRTRTRPLIDALFLHPEWRRQGIGRILLDRAAQEVRAHDGSALCSGYLLANSGSAGWHRAVGFMECPNRLVTTHRYRCLRHNLRRGLVHDAFGAAQRARRLKARIDDMRAAQQNDPEAHAPVRWLNGNGTHIDAFLADREEEKTVW